MNESKRPHAFVSYSHNDKPIAEKLARDLSESGLRVFFDDWDILPGDSIIERIFQKGLKDCDIFIILLSQSSVRSKWVQEELDAATIKKIEGTTRIIPVLIEQCDIPVQLRATKWVDYTEGKYEQAVRDIVRAAFEDRSNPERGEIPNYVTAMNKRVAGLSKEATAIGLLLLDHDKDDYVMEPILRVSEIGNHIPLNPQEIDDAIDELEDHGLVETIDYSGTSPYRHGDVMSTYALSLLLGKITERYDPEEDIKVVAAAVAAKRQVGGDEIKELTKLPPLRINRAVEYLEDYGYAKVHKLLGTAPYRFDTVEATYRTKQLVDELERE